MVNICKLELLIRGDLNFNWFYSSLYNLIWHRLEWSISDHSIMLLNLKHCYIWINKRRANEILCLALVEKTFHFKLGWSHFYIKKWKETFGKPYWRSNIVPSNIILCFYVTVFKLFVTAFLFLVLVWFGLCSFCFCFSVGPQVFLI